MPTYQYVCTNPDEPHEFERVQSFTDAAISECPTCGFPVRKRYGSVGVVFKGSGFYRNDSRGAASSGDGGNSDSKSELKTDAKADAKADSKSDASKSGAAKSDASKSDSSSTKSDSPSTSKAASTSSSSAAG